MPAPLPLRLVELRGLVRLIADATEGVTDVVEGVHQAVHGTLGFGERAAGRTGGLTGHVYRSVRALTRIAGSGADRALALIDRGAHAPLAAAPQDDHRRAALLAVLNGVLGDHLARQSNPLATAMTLRLQGQPLDGSALPAAALGSHVVVLLHGLCMNDLQWRSVGRDGDVVDHGADLAAALGCTALTLRYNSGRPIVDNGRELSAQLERLVGRWPGIRRLTLIGHSMGGLVARSAVHAADDAQHGWRDRLREMVFLGTPHHGAPLERAGHWVTGLLQSNPYSAPFARLALLRSAGITDLRHGRVHDATEVDPLPLPDAIACYTIAATLASGPGALADRLTGDGLVPLRSALGQHDDPRLCLDFPPQRQWIARGTGHLELLSAPAVGSRLRDWLAAD